MSTVAGLVASIGLTALVALVGATWRIGTRVGEVTSTLQSHTRAISDIEAHLHEHDMWHIAQQGRDRR